MAVALVIGSALNGTGVAHASIPKIPPRFLLTEPAAIAGPVVEGEEWWKIDNSLTTQLEPDPCHTKAKPRDGRVAIRTITYSTSAPSGSSEQLVLYGSARSAQAAFRRLRADLTTCSKQAMAKSGAKPEFGYAGKPVRIADEAMSVAGYFYTRGKRAREPGELQVAARRGAALFLYTDIGDGAGAGKKILGQARKMAKKVCALPGVCGSATG